MAAKIPYSKKQNLNITEEKLPMQEKALIHTAKPLALVKCAVTASVRLSNSLGSRHVIKILKVKEKMARFMIRWSALPADTDHDDKHHSKTCT